MKKITAIVMVFALIIILPSILLARQYDRPTGFVNDFANIIPDEKQKSLEKKLLDNDAATTNQISILTTPSMGSQSIEEFCIDHAQGWGVGQKGKDNGILICVAVQERKYRVEIGYGLEGTITDVIAGQLADKLLKPAFRRGDYAGGIEDLVDALINRLSGPNAVQEPAQSQTKDSVADKEFDKLFSNFLMGLLFLVLLGFGGYGSYRGLMALSAVMKERKRKKALREKISGILDQMQKKTEGFWDVAENEGKGQKEYPQWAFIKSKDYTSSLVETADRLHQNISELELLVKDNPDSVEMKLPELERMISSAEAKVAELSSIPRTMAALEKKAPDKVAEVIVDLGNLEVFAKTMIDSGYQLEKIEFSKKTEEIETAISTIKQMLGSNSTGKDSKAYEICQAANMVQKEIGSLRELLGQLEQTKKYVDEKIGPVQNALTALIQKKDSFENVLDSVIKENPEEVWKEEHEDLLCLPGIFNKAEWLIESAQKNVSMDEQNFNRAKKQIDGVETMIAGISGIYENIVMKTKQIDESKNICSGIGSAESLVEKAKHAVSDSDVESDTKGLARDAEVKLEKSKTTISAGGLVNWLLAAALMTESKNLAKNAIHKAQEDIDEAERRRRKKKEEEEEEESARRRRSSSSYSSSSYSSSSSSSSSGFGGFGGGGFGGGGASGGW